MSGTGYKSGFFSIIGCPNVGKSTLMNALVGQKVSIVTARAQTTRNRIVGIRPGSGYQMVFLDTPGITRSFNKLGDYMQKTAEKSLSEMEAVLFLADASKGVGERDQRIIERLNTCRSPLIAIINKTDIASKATVDEAESLILSAGIFRHVLKISAKTGEGIDKLVKLLESYLVEGPQYYPDDMVTDQPERVICAEIIREKALMLLQEEIPHGIGVMIERMQSRPDSDLMDIWATIYCERDSHKGIIIGRGGRMLKRIGTEARTDMENLLGVRVNLQLWIKVKEDWRNKSSFLNELGYAEE